jgi:TRAP-type C4-dicarboxylate transport system permease small subunit
MEQDLTSKVETLLHHASLYVEQRKDLLVLDVTEKSSRAISEVLYSVLVVVLTVLTLIFASIAAAWSIGQAIDDMPMGFLYVALFYLMVTIISMVVNKSFIQPNLINYFICRFHKEPTV